MTIQQRDSDTYSICGRIDFGKPIFSRALHMLLHYLYISFYNLSLVFLSWTALHCHKNIDFRSTRKRASKCEYHDIGACNYNVIFWPSREYLAHVWNVPIPRVTLFKTMFGAFGLPEEWGIFTAHGFCTIILKNTSFDTPMQSPIPKRW